MAEFQAVIMAAGTGSRMFPLTERIPKALLPVGNLPLIWYPINLLDKAGFEEIIIVVLDSALTRFHQLLPIVCNPRLKLDFVTIPDDADMGTADALRYIKDKIEKDIFVVSCDLVTDIALHHLADIHRSHDSTVSAFLAPVPQTSADREFANNPKAKKKTDNTDQYDYISIDSRESRLLFFATEADLDEILVIRKPLLKRYPCINIVKNLMDAHLYIIKKWIVDYLAENKSISSIKGELIPFLVNKQFQKNKKANKVDPKSVSTVVEEFSSIRPDIYDFAKEDDIMSYTRQLSSWSGTLTDIDHSNSIRCHAYVMENGICLRTNTIPLYVEANRQIPKLLPGFTSKEITLIHPLATIKPKSQVGNDCMVDESVSIGEKVSIKKSVIGKHTVIGERVKISNSVIMDHVTIMEGCNVQGSIICTNAHIKKNVSLKDCQVGDSHTISEGADLKGEALIAEHMMDFE
ncbi:translation initiation factor eIF2B subunit gamma-like [Pocillopora verrucosa]|uniref:translation initiation factor eIF2B subunit gamma-like n=1 Tax=Pocillopora verrucosa TaxID=203993 RepID=UPI00333E7C56